MFYSPLDAKTVLSLSGLYAPCNYYVYGTCPAVSEVFGADAFHCLVSEVVFQLSKGRVRSLQDSMADAPTHRAR